MELYLIYKKDIDHKVIDSQHNILGDAPKTLVEIHTDQNAAQARLETLQKQEMDQRKQLNCDPSEYIMEPHVCVQPDPACYTHPHYVQFNIARVRPSENEHWFNIVYMRVNEDDATDWTHLSAAEGKRILLNQIQNHLATAAGWKSICQACKDYNWGDFIMDLHLYNGQLTMDEPETGRLRGIIDLLVNQDELLAPDVVYGKLVLHYPDGNSQEIDATLDMQCGSLDTDGEFDPNEVESAFFRVDRKDETLPCDPQEDFMMLQES